MEVHVYNQQAEPIGKLNLSDAVFAVPMNQDLLYQVVTSMESNRRQVIAHAKGRSEVRGGGKKPWQQKGTGRARHGSIRSPIWKGGGVTHGPTKEANFKKKINQKVARKALAVALSAKLRDSQIMVVDTISLLAAKTKAMAEILKKLSVGMGDTQHKTKPSLLIVVPSSKDSESIRRSAANLPKVTVTQATDLNVLMVLGSKHILMLKESVPLIEKFTKISRA